ncbi:hypothetical protein H9P43_001615 [Blastocladiella emersonii ATCC 22665]|nr:hypothetical protein H9P43_001615 [Blastocladiella emersonii ATCC 22665]
MVQSVNFAGIRALAWVIRSPAVARPHLSVPDISHLDFPNLHASGVRCIVFDKDNCLTAPYSDAVHPSVEKAFAECIRVFGRSNVAIYSNSAGTLDDKNGAQAERLEESLGVPVLRHKEKKPAGGSSIKRHFSGVIKSPSEVAFVGDRVMTDMVFANRNGFRAIHTFRVLTEAGDNPLAKWIRRGENWWLYGKGRP